MAKVSALSTDVCSLTDHARHDIDDVEWDVKPQIKQTNPKDPSLHKITPLFKDPFFHKITPHFKYELRHEKTCFCHMQTTKAQIKLRIVQSDQCFCYSLPR